MNMNEWSDDAFAGYLAGMIDGEGHIVERIMWRGKWVHIGKGKIRRQ